MKVKNESEVAQSCLTQRTHGLQPTRLLRPWEFPGKSTRVGCHCLLQFMSMIGVQKFGCLFKAKIAWGECEELSEMTEVFCILVVMVDAKVYTLVETH